ncbi:ankyrin repeat domain-containing protein [Chryseobacterium arthrosphaerae]|uniref:ankyrin repeat domain-containing protein n=1 Tax=Chryseobacterium arthrosphaerae TaxID=651561 RepID=UPI00241D1355|nr:ankyrin repeat domain-containing protein [Chryseobacterium arthrosphaerae]
MNIHQLAIKEDPTELKKMLEEYPESINEREKGMLQTPLMLAAEMERVQSVKLLLEYGADPNLQNIDGKTALHLLPVKQPAKQSTPEAKVEIAALLLENGADINIKDNYNNEPLWTAVFEAADGDSEKLPLVAFYVKNHADVNNKNKSDRSPMDFAQKVGWQPLIDVLQDKN